MKYKELSHTELVKKVEELTAKLAKTQWLNEMDHIAETEPYEPFYGDVTQLNTERTIIDALGQETLKALTSDLMDLLDTSLAIYEKNGDYAFGVFNSGWCQLLDASSRKRCNTDDNKTALHCGKWLCHDDCWNNSAKATIIGKKSIDINCIGGIKLYSEPIFVDGEVIGVINIGYGNPPTDDKTLTELSEKYTIDFETLKQKATAYKPRPDFIIEVAKKRLKSIAKLIGEIVLRKKIEQELNLQNHEFTELYKELLKTKDRIERSELLFKTMFSEAPLGIALINSLNGQIYEVNPKFAEIAGRTQKEMATIDWMSITHPDDVQEDLDNMALLNAGKIKGFNMQKRYIKPNGSYVWINMTIAPISAEDNQLPRHLGMIEDITQRKQVEQELLNAKEKAEVSEEKYKRLTENAQDMIYRMSLKDDKYEYVSPASTNIFEFEPQEFYDNPLLIADVIHPEFRDYFKREWKKLVKGDMSPTYEFKIRTKSGIEKWLYQRNVLIRDKLNNPIAIEGIVTDITKMKVAEEALRESEAGLRHSNKTKDKFLSIIAHDLLNPFTSMAGFADLLYKRFESFDTAKKKEFIGYIRSGIRSTHKLLQNLLLWSRAQKGNIQFNLEKMDLYAVANEIIELSDQQAANKSVKITNRIVENTNIQADKFMLSTIVRNLISNAIKYSHKDGAIVIDALQNDRFIEITIADDGVGISKEDQSELFDININESTKGTENESGTGLGLILCKEFVEYHGGEIWVESEFGSGAAFHFTIPQKG